MIRATSSISTLVILAPALLAQSNPDFSTGPPNVPAVRPDFVPPDGFPSPADGDDIRANTATTSAQNETSLAVNPLDPLNWVGVANDYRFGGVETGWYTTTNGGQTWTSGTFGVDPGFSFSGDPCVAFDNNGDAHIACMMYDGPGGNDKVMSFNSTNGGLTWGAGVPIGILPGYDKPQIEADLASGSPFENHLIVAWDHFGATFSSDDIVVSTSSNGGATWTTPQVINTGSTTGIGPDVAWGPNGEAYVMWADRGVDEILIDRSFNGGATWGPDIKVADFVHVPDTLPGSPFRMFDVFAMHADQSDGPYSGNIYVAYHTWTSGFGNHRADVLVSTSSDDGATWSPGVKISSDGAQLNDQVMPGICVDPQGNVNVTYYDQRNDAADVLVWTWLSRSSDGGATWRDIQISDVGWNPSPTEFGGTFIGDYIDTDCTNRTVLPFWCDGRSGSQDVYTDVVNLALFTNVDSLSAATGGTVNFFINVGPNHGGENYLLLASGSGTSPGVTSGGINVPINQDFWTTLSVAFANSAIFPNSLGVLDAEGSSLAQMDSLGPFDPAFVGTNLDFSIITFGSDGVLTHATAPTGVSLNP
ncbi:MAG: sialidase family protein [Planctomycetota bacterium]